MYGCTWLDIWSPVPLHWERQTYGLIPLMGQKVHNIVLLVNEGPLLFCLQNTCGNVSIFVVALLWFSWLLLLVVVVVSKKGRASLDRSHRIRKMSNKRWKYTIIFSWIFISFYSYCLLKRAAIRLLMNKRMLREMGTGRGRNERMNV